MKSKIVQIGVKKLVGKSMRMSLIKNQTFKLWNDFMPRRKEIKNQLHTDLYSMQIYDSAYFNDFNPNTEFTKWAAVEVSSFDDVPDGMDSYVLKGGIYAVFLHVGSSQEFARTMQYILGKWLPESEYQLDDREHFELLGEKYKNNDPASEEEVWIPIKKK